MEEQAKKLQALIEGADKIIVTSHISPDPDAVSSALLLVNTLKANFPDKQVHTVLEEEPLGLDFLTGYKDLEFGPLYDALVKYKPALLILVDANNYDRSSRLDGGKIREYIQQNAIKSVIIDHHEPAGKDNTDVYINQGSPAAAQDVYEVCFGILNLKKPEGFAQTAMLGLYADSGGFAYKNPRHSDTLKMADELLSAGADIEQINTALNQYTDDDILVFAELAANTSRKNDYNYSFVRDEFVSEWLAKDKSAQLHKGTEAFVNHFIRNIGGRKWGFIVYKNILQGGNIYSASFRSIGDAKDVSLIAASLGGGGHKPAAGAKFEAANVTDAIAKVTAAIENAGAS